MLEAKREGLAFEPEDVVELKQIVADADEKAAFAFLRDRIYKRILSAQGARLKSHLDGTSDPAGSFKRRNQ
ncbi:MAG: hypothetical protein QME71_02575 [Dehalococcoidia bacterium]|nr:hypothetical protein [Dehalococcoidia bacterium]